MTQLSFTSIKAQLFTGSQKLSRVLRYHPEMQKILGLRRLRDMKPLPQENWRLSSHSLVTRSPESSLGRSNPRTVFGGVVQGSNMLKAAVGGISEMHFLHTFRLTCKTGCLQVPSTAEWPPSPARDK